MENGGVKPPSTPLRSGYPPMVGDFHDGLGRINAGSLYILPGGIPAKAGNAGSEFGVGSAQQAKAPAGARARSFPVPSRAAHRNAPRPPPASPCEPRPAASSAAPAPAPAPLVSRRSPASRRSPLARSLALLACQRARGRRTWRLGVQAVERQSRAASRSPSDQPFTSLPSATRSRAGDTPWRRRTERRRSGRTTRRWSCC